MLIAKYTANKSGVVPTFNSGYQYTKNETVSNGIYTVEITSDTDFTSCSFGSKNKLLTVEYLKVTNKVTDMSDMFEYCSSLTSIGDVSNWDTSNVTKMDYMFYGCSQLTQLDASNWDTSKVGNMSKMFYDCSQLTQLDLSNWDTSNVTTMSYMFQHCSQLTQLDLSNFDTSSVINMSNMFYYCSKLIQLDLSGFNTSKVTTMTNMFYNCSQLTQLDLSNWDTSNVTTMNGMFSNCTSLNDVVATNVSTSTLSTLVTALPTRTSDSYGTIRAKNTTDEVTSSSNAKYWNVKVPMLIARYTANASGVVPTFNDGYQYTVNEVESNGVYTVEINSDTDFTSCSFRDISNLLTVEYLKVTDKVTNINSMFYFCTSLTQLDVSNWDTSNVTNMGSMFSFCYALTQLDLSNWNTSNVINIGYMFYYCHRLAQLDVSNWDTSKTSIMYDVFYNCKSLNTVIATNVSTSTLSTLITILPTRTSDSYGTIRAKNTTDEVTSSANAKYWNIKTLMIVARYTANASGVVPTFNDGYQYAVNEVESNGVYTVEINSDTDFTSCSFKSKSNLLTVEYLKVTDNVTDTSNMFEYCNQLTQVDVSNWDTSKVTRMRYIFRNCSQLAQLDLSNWDTSSVTDMGYMFRSCSSLTQLDLSNFNTSSVTRMDEMFDYCSQLTQLDVSNWDTSSVADMSFMFSNCSQLTQLDVSNFNTRKVTTMNYMFYGCSRLTQLDISNWDTSNATVGNMFNYCGNLIVIGMIYCNLKTINTLSSKLPTDKAKQVYVHDVNSSECTEVSNITFIDYIGDSNVITLPVTLVPGDEILWDDSSQRYIIKRSDGTTIQTDITSKFKIDLYTPYTMIYTDNVTSISVNIFRKEI